MDLKNPTQMAISLSLDLTKEYRAAETLEFSIDSARLTSVDKPLVRGGDVKAEVSVHPAAYGLRLGFRLTGKVTVDCDRCLDPLDLPIYTEQTLRLKHGDTYQDDGETVSIPQGQTQLDLWPFIYDYIMLAIPLQHSHAQGQCNKEMEQELRRYLVDNI